jgi:ABC-2 type transport system ATP-binding protein
MNENSAILVRDLHRSFGDIEAVGGIDFEVKKGEILSLLGPNGAGKTTTISIISCLLRPDEGDVQVLGTSILDDPQAVKAFLGVVPQEIAVYEDLSARENLIFWGKMYGLRGNLLGDRVEEVLEITGLGDRQKDKVEKFSGGMKRRLNIGIALLNKPEILIMDEPTVGIDPQSRRNILDRVMDFNREGTTILYTTHYMEEAQELSDHIAIMDHGKLIAYGSHEELVKIVGELDRIELTIDTDTDGLLEAWKTIPGVNQVTSEDGGINLLVDDSNLVLPHLFEAATAKGVRITSVEITEANLEAVFLHLTGRALRD